MITCSTRRQLLSYTTIVYVLTSFTTTVSWFNFKPWSTHRPNRQSRLSPSKSLVIYLSNHYHLYMIVDLFGYMCNNSKMVYTYIHKVYTKIHNIYITLITLPTSGYINIHVEHLNSYKIVHDCPTSIYKVTHDYTTSIYKITHDYTTKWLWVWGNC